MTYSVYQPWDPLRVCVVGRSYPPEFYSWIKIPKVRKLFERIAIETEEDFQSIINLLKKFNVEVIRPDLIEDSFAEGKYTMPPMMPRDYTVMIGQTFYNNHGFNFKKFYDIIKDSTWPSCSSMKEFQYLPERIKIECIEMFNIDTLALQENNFSNIFKKISSQGNCIKHHVSVDINGAGITKMGKDLYFSIYNSPIDEDWLRNEFSDYRIHVIKTAGHGDGTYCPVCPGLIVSLMDIPTYKDTFPGWEVVYLPDQSWHAVQPFLDLKEKTQGKWWIPGFEYDTDVVDVVETWLGHWTGYVEETVFDVNMLIIDPKNVAVFNYNRQVFDALDRYGITPHVVPFRHRYFWDGGIHCVTSDLHREGAMQDFFPERSRV